LAEAAAPPSARLDRVVLLLSSSTAQQKALTVALADLQDPSSPHYHQWLTPASFARDYANSASDVSALSDWLESEGLEVAPAPAGRGWIEFSGTVADVEHAFHTRIAAQTTSAGTRFLLAGTISVPGALAPLVLG
jgi:subtilase family serine protease